MGRTRRGIPVHGWVAVDKPEGITSTAVVARVRRAFGAQKAGHGGTLDPLASGILPVALGEATKTVPYVMDGRKVYRFTVHFGEERSTDDREGEVTATSAYRPSCVELEAALPAFVGTIEQVPPRFSAIRLDGRRAYDLARGGVDVELKARSVRVDSFVLESWDGADSATFRVETGKGVYVRSLARDLARSVGSVGHVSMLRRCQCGPFSESNAISLDKLDELGHSPGPVGFLLSVTTALDDIPVLALTEEEARRLSSGLPVDLLPVLARTGDGPDGIHASASVAYAMQEDRPVAIVRIEDGVIRPVRVMNL